MQRRAYSAYRFRFRGSGDRSARERGVVTLENVIIYPAILLFFAIALHVGIQFHNSNVTQAAATIALNTARVVGGTGGAGEAAARAYLEGTPMGSAAIQVERGPEVTTATVSGVSTSFVSWLGQRVEHRVSAPTERWID